MLQRSLPRPIVALLAGLLAVVAAPTNRLVADTILDSGTTTISTGTDFGAQLFVGVSGTATLEVVDGASVTNGSGYLGSGASGDGTVLVTGGTWTNAGALVIGSAGTGSLTVLGGSVTATSGTIGGTGVGSATVASGGAWTTLGDLDVVNGALTVGEGGHVAVAGRLQNTASGTINLRGGTLQIGIGGTTGELDVFGWLENYGSTLVFNRADASTFAGRYLGVGRLVKQGAGALTITGEVYCRGFLFGDGGVAIHSGTLVLPSGTLQNTATFDPTVVGDASGDSGFLEVTGGQFYSNRTAIGRDAGSVGTATMSSGSMASNVLVVGASGTGTLNVTGGSVNSWLCTIGANAGGVGAVTMSGGNWYSNDDLTVGRDGAGTLTLNGGTLFVLRSLSRGASGTIALAAGGTLSIGNGGTVGELAVPTLTNNGSLIFSRSDDTSYAGVISGSGAVIKQGDGTLSLAAINFYTGVTTISGGTLTLTGNASIGTGGLNLGTTASRGTFDIGAMLSGSYSLPSTGDLVGAGTIKGSGKTLAVEGSFRPGNSPGTVTVDTGLTLDLASSIASTFEFTNPAFTAGTFDLVNGDGGVVYGGVLNLSFSGGSYANGTDVVQIFANTGGRSGGFTSINTSGLAAGQSALFDPVSGKITVVPEPAGIPWAVAAGLAALVLAGSGSGTVGFPRRSIKDSPVP
jgi:fibronectin-binding autotransporter adhesin